jgi:SAM-dependent methyltransferase
MEQAGAFAGKVLSDMSGGMVSVLAGLGDRLGLFRELEAGGPATAEQLAVRADINERYAREWLGGMAAAGYLDYDPTSDQFALPAAHAAALAQEGGPFSVGAAYEMMLAEIGQFDRVAEAFKLGGGVPQSDYDARLWEGQERFSVSWVENFLIPGWLAAMSEARAKLENGAAVADVGCGAGRALVKLAQTYPASHFVGYDVFEPVVGRATAIAQAAGVADRVRFQQLDATRGLPGRYDVITTFDVVHDAIDPQALLSAIRQALNPDGLYICLEMNCADHPQDNTGPVAALLHGISIFYCMTTSLASGGAALGTLGLPEGKLREACITAGFRTTQRIPLQDPFHSLYLVRP